MNKNKILNVLEAYENDLQEAMQFAKGSCAYYIQQLNRVADAIFELKKEWK